MQATQTNAQDVVQAYIDAFGARDLARCVGIFDEQAVIEYGPASYRGSQMLEQWHQERFTHNMTVVNIKDISCSGDTVTVEGTITSNRLKAWRVGTLSGKAKFLVRDGKIASVSLSLRHDYVLGFFR